MEPPECPVCLQPYDSSTAVIPRVLSCGHSACESCLALLPSRPAVPNAVRCPACTQLVTLPPLGPTALPKNIDLLRLSNPESTPNPKPKIRREPEPFLPPVSFPDHLVATWKDRVLPPDSLSSPGSDTTYLDSRRVSLFPILTSPSSDKPSWLWPSYLVRVMDSVARLEEMARDQLGILFQAVETQRRGLSRVYGLWMDSNELNSPLFVVFESFDVRLSDFLKSRKLESGSGLDGDEKFRTWMVGLEICEILMALHSKGVVLGCLVPDCLGFDEFRHCVLDLNNILLTARRIREGKIGELVSPEVFATMRDGAVTSEYGLDGSVGYQSDSWSLCCILALIVVGDSEFAAQLVEEYCCMLSGDTCENFAEEFLGQYEVWREKIWSKLESLLLETKFESLLRMLSDGLSYNQKSRPQVRDIWHCIRGLFLNSCDGFPAFNVVEPKKNFPSCFVIDGLCSIPKKVDNDVSPQEGNNGVLDKVPEVGLDGGTESNMDHLPQGRGDGDLLSSLKRGAFKSVTLQCHHDCITGLAIGGGYLFSSSFDKTVNVWSLQDFSHIKSLKGHEHRIMSIIVVDSVEPLCISGDNGGGIIVWSIIASPGQEMVKKWNEQNDWRYSGIHSLAISGTECLYSGSGDKSIKVWSLQDYSLSGVMTGHKSTVSSLKVADGILYSGSWDGTIRLWCLNDHSLLSILGDDTPGSCTPVLSLFVDCHLVVASYENGHLKLWRNDVLVRSMQIQDGAIFALHMDTKWLFTGGWNKIVNIQELSENELQVDITPVASIACDSVITSLSYWRGKLFVGLSNKEIKVYYHGD